MLDQRPLLGELGSASASLLEDMYRPEDALFPHSTRQDARGLEHTFEHPHTIRYTINTLLGLQRAARSGCQDRFLQKCGPNQASRRATKSSYSDEPAGEAHATEPAL